MTQADEKRTTCLGNLVMATVSAAALRTRISSTDRSFDLLSHNTTPVRYRYFLRFDGTGAIVHPPLLFVTLARVCASAQPFNKRFDSAHLVCEASTLLP